jgi:hypothetical protein
MWLEGNAVVEYALRPIVLIDAISSRSHVGREGGVWRRSHYVSERARGGHSMHYLSDVVDRRPMLRVAGQIVLAFSCAAPLVLLLCFLI